MRFWKSEIDICTRIFDFAKRTVGFQRYPTVRLGAPAKLKYLHSKIGRRVDLARVRYGTMQSERMRIPQYPPVFLYHTAVLKLNLYKRGT